MRILMQQRRARTMQAIVAEKPAQQAAAGAAKAKQTKRAPRPTSSTLGGWLSLPTFPIPAISTRR